MLSILLINDNKIVSRLFQLSSQKQGYDLEESPEYKATKDAYNIIFIDDHIYDEGKFLDLKSKINLDKRAYLGEKGKAKPEAFDLLLEKPFLPTDFINLMQENFKVVGSKEEIDEQIDENTDSGDEFDLDSLEEIEIGDELQDLEEMDLDMLEDTNDSSLEDTKNDSKLQSKDEISDVLADIDELDTPKKEDLDSPILSEDLVKEALEEVKDEESKDLTKEVLTTVGASVATAVAAENILDSKQEDETLNDGLDELDSLDERMVKEAILGEKIIDTDDANEDNMVTGEANEEFIESSDLEAIIQKAVSKALSQEMLSKALEELEIVVSFRQKSS